LLSVVKLVVKLVVKKIRPLEASAAVTGMVAPIAGPD
jgi:hypothetical protein